jgi:hypothetical protein
VVKNLEVECCSQEGISSKSIVSKIKKRLGFSGTPSDLLPLELGKCQYEAGSDGKMVNYLTSTEIVDFTLIEGIFYFLQFNLKKR